MGGRPVKAETTAGWVEGRVVDGTAAGTGVAAFRGVPYGADPVGDRRFREAAPAEGWPGVRPALDPGPAPPQSTTDPMAGLVPGGVPALISEVGCLNLEVRAPEDMAPGAARPVMVWVHGGAFRTGASSLPAYDATRLVAEHGVVVVSPNYRLGALGFLHLPDAGDVAPNCGLTDLVLALRWVRDNAAAFGGDPGNVTLFGESAGAGAILHLLAVPAAAGLFSRAIMQSPGVTQTLDAGRAALVTECLLRQLELSPDASVLRELPAHRLVAAQEAATAELAASVGAMPFHPVVDGALLTELPLAALAGGRAAKVEAVVGTCEDEMRLFAAGGLAKLDRARIVSVLRPVVAQAHGSDPGPEAVDELIRRYETVLASEAGPGAADGAGAGPADVWAAVLTDGLMRLPAEQLLEAHHRHGPSTRACSFAWKPGGRAAPLGSFHAVDIPFTFGTFDREGWGEFLAAGPEAERVSAAVRAAWTAFAGDGRPDRVVPTGWDPWDPERRRTLVLADPVRQADDPMRERRAAWEALPGVRGHEGRRGAPASTRKER